VLVPTRELSEQIYDVAISISLNTKINLSLVNAGKNYRAQKTLLNKKNDLVVATPYTLLVNHKTLRVYFGNVNFIVIDEVDTMFSNSFRSDITNIIDACRFKEKPCRFIFVSAILTFSVPKLINQVIPKLKKITMPIFQKGVSGMVHFFKKISYGVDKIDFLVDLLESELIKRKCLLIFCNTIQSCRAVKYALYDCGLLCFQCHGTIPYRIRREKFLRFMSFLKWNDQFYKIKNYKVIQSGRKGMIMVCTDIVARGLNFRRIDHIINFDFPFTSNDYQHRSGRTARAG